MKLLNDSKYRLEADKLKARIDKLPAGSPELEALQTRYKALVDSIGSDVLKPG